jgi:hypothetical protein
VTTIYFSDREIGIMWDDRGAIHTVDRQGNHGERFTPPPGSVVLFSNENVAARWSYSDTWE